VPEHTRGGWYMQSDITSPNTKPQCREIQWIDLHSLRVFAGYYTCMKVRTEVEIVLLLYT